MYGFGGGGGGGGGGGVRMSFGPLPRLAEEEEEQAEVGNPWEEEQATARMQPLQVLFFHMLTVISRTAYLLNKFISFFAG